MRRLTNLGLLLVWLIGGIPAFGLAQGAPAKRACDLLTRADVKSVLGVPLEDGTSLLHGGRVGRGRVVDDDLNVHPLRRARLVVNAAPSSSGVSGSRGSTPAPVRHCRQVQVGSFSTQHGRGAISAGGATTTVCD